MGVGLGIVNGFAARFGGSGVAKLCRASAISPLPLEAGSISKRDSGTLAGRRLVEEVVVSVRNLSYCIYDDVGTELTLLDDVTFDALPGTITAIMGPSGSGTRCGSRLDQHSLTDLCFRQDNAAGHHGVPAHRRRAQSRRHPYQRLFDYGDQHHCYLHSAAGLRRAAPRSLL